MNSGNSETFLPRGTLNPQSYDSPVLSIFLLTVKHGVQRGVLGVTEFMYVPEWGVKTIPHPLHNLKELIAPVGRCPENKVREELVGITEGAGAFFHPDNKPWQSAVEFPRTRKRMLAKTSQSHSMPSAYFHCSQ